MKAILRQLLQAEEAGRQAAGDCETRGEALLLAARAESEKVVEDLRAATRQRVEQLNRQSQEEIDRGRKVIEAETDAAIELQRTQAAERRPLAIKDVVALLLAEK